MARRGLINRKERRAEERLQARRTARLAAEAVFKAIPLPADVNERRAFLQELKQLCDKELRTLISEDERLRRSADAFTPDCGVLLAD